MSRRGWVLFSAMCVIWGIPYLLIKVAVSELSPVDVVFGRCLVAVVLLLPVAAARGELRPLLPLLEAVARLHGHRGRRCPGCCCRWPSRSCRVR